MTNQWLVLTACFTPMLAAVAVIRGWRWRKDRIPERLPISEKLLRPAGETLRKRLEAVEETLDERMAMLLVVPFVVAVMSLNSDARVVRGITFISATLAALFCIWLIRELLRIADEKRNLRLGFHGERAVAEELNLLMLEGCRIYHDVPMEPYGNIDHVIVDSSGVYAVETKTARKPAAIRGKRDYEVVYNGKAMQFPDGRSTSEPVEQAIRQAKQLGQWLTNATGDSVRATAILTYPGWLVTSRVKAELLAVLNPRKIGEFVLQRKANLPVSSAQIQRIVYQLDQKCRDVEI